MFANKFRIVAMVTAMAMLSGLLLIFTAGTSTELKAEEPTTPTLVTETEYCKIYYFRKIATTGIGYSFFIAESKEAGASCSVSG